MVVATGGEDAPVPPRRGRPTLVNPLTIAAEAFRLWSARGVQATTWAEIAEASGVSIRTLMRHFPAQTDIAWVGVPAAVERLRRELDAAPARLAAMAVVRRGVHASVIDPAYITQEWLQLVANDPQLRAAASVGWRPWTAAISAFIAARAPAASAVVCAALAAAVQAATFTALLEAVDDRTAAVDAALDALDFRLPTRWTRGTP
jgi:AcrR family transcriptional regulator